MNILKVGFILFGLSAVSTKTGLDISVTLISIGFVILCITEKKFFNTQVFAGLKEFLYLSVIFLSILLVSTIFSYDIKNSVKRFIIILGYYGLFLGVLKLKNEKFIKNILRIIVMVSIIESLYTVTQYFFGFDFFSRKEIYKHCRSMGTLGYPNDLGFSFGIFLPFLISLFWNEKILKLKIFYLIGCIFMFVGLILTFTRGAWLSLIIAIFFMAIVREKKFLLILCIIIISLVLLPFSRKRLIDTFQFKENARIFFLKHTPEFILKRPLFGWGLDSFNKVFYEKYPQIEAHFHPHNMYLNIAFQSGIFGFGTFLLIFYFLLKFFLHYLKIEQEFTRTVLWGCIGSIVYFLSHGFIDEPFRGYQCPYLLFFIIGLSFWYIGSKDKSSF